MAKSTWIILAVIAVIVSLQLFDRTNIPEHMLQHPVTVVEDLLYEGVKEKLDHLAKTHFKEFPTNVNDLKHYKTKHQHIGEATGFKNGKCEHPYMVPNINRTFCAFPGRIDIGRHFLLTGGVTGLKESYQSALGRLQSFGTYIFNPSDYDIVEELFNSKKFREAAQKTCPKDKQYLDPFQFNFIIQVPGQTVALHIDGVYFWGATRFQFPQWLLAAMKFSGLYEEEFIDQIQVVAYFHDWNSDEIRRGQFVYWDTNEHPKTVPPNSNLGSVVDGSKIVHASMVYYPSKDPPILDKSKSNVLKYNADKNNWSILSNNKTIIEYPDDELRKTIVYRARCFANKEEKEQYYEMLKDDDKQLKLEDILTTFKEDLIKRGVINKGDDLTPLELGLKIQSTYIKYPLPPTALIPFNYYTIFKFIKREILSYFSS